MVGNPATEEDVDGGWGVDASLVFRERRGFDNVLLGDHCHNITITLEDGTLGSGHNQQNKPANKTVLCLSWEGLQRSGCYFYMCEVGLRVGKSKDVSSDVLQKLCERRYETLRELTERFFTQFKAKITKVKYHPLSFEFAYLNSNVFEVLGSRIGAIEDLLKDISSRMLEQDLSVSVCLHQRDEEDEDETDDEELYEEDIEFTLSLGGSDNEGEDITNMPLDGSRTVSKTIRSRLKENEKRLENLENEFQIQREQMNERLNEMQENDREHQNLLRSLVQSIDVLVKRHDGASIVPVMRQTSDSSHTVSLDGVIEPGITENRSGQYLNHSYRHPPTTQTFTNAEESKYHHKVDQVSTKRSEEIVSLRTPADQKRGDMQTNTHTTNQIVQNKPIQQAKRTGEPTNGIQTNADKDEISSFYGKGARPKISNRSSSVPQSKHSSPENKAKSFEANQFNTPTLKLRSEINPNIQRNDIDRRQKMSMQSTVPKSHESHDDRQYHSLNITPQRNMGMDMPQGKLPSKSMDDQTVDDKDRSSLPRLKQSQEQKIETNAISPNDEDLSYSLPSDPRNKETVKQNTFRKGRESWTDDVKSKRTQAEETGLSNPPRSAPSGKRGVQQSETTEREIQLGNKTQATKRSTLPEKTKEQNKLTNTTSNKTSEEKTNKVILNKTEPETDTSSQASKESLSPRSLADPPLVSTVLQGNTGGKARHFLATYGVKGTTPGVRRMIETVEAAHDAMQEDGVRPLRSGGLNTVLCLDTSDAMGEEAFVRMKEAAGDFIDGIEDIAGLHDMEENIGVVACGGSTRIVHQLSNDYSTVKEAVEKLGYGGNASLFEALLVCMCALDTQKDGGQSAGSSRHPRLIVMTSGCTVDGIEDQTVDEETVANNSKDRVIKLVGEFNSGDTTKFPRPIIWIPFNDDDRDLFDHLAEMDHCSVVECAEMTDLCLYQRRLGLVKEVYRNIRDKVILTHDTEVDEDDVLNEVKHVAGTMAVNDLEQIVSNVVDMLKETLSRTQLDPKRLPSDFGDVCECRHTSLDLPLPGERVVRGDNWNRGEEDSRGPGTVINHVDGQEEEERKIVWVLWDNGFCGKYRYGFRDAFDVKTTLDQPRHTKSELVIHIGCEVTRGQDWCEKYDNQDGGAGGVGVVIRKNEHGKVMVRWRRTNHANEYRYGKDNKLDLRIRDLEECMVAQSSPGKQSREATSEPSKKGQPKSVETAEGGGWVWQWKTEAGAWKLYDQKVCDKLEKEYTRRPQGSCVIVQEGKSSRVLFKNFIEKKVDDNTCKSEVRRICMSESDQAALRRTDEK